MDEYWRTCMEISATQNFPHRKSMENAGFTMNNAAMFAANHHDLDADDFSDVFGGPPRTVLYRKFSRDFNTSASFYDEAFQTLDFSPSYSTKIGRSLPVFRIPARGEGFYNDNFWLDNDLRRSSWELPESDSSSVLSWEEPIPLRPPTENYIGLSSFAPKLREPEAETRVQSNPVPEYSEDDDEDGDEIMSSYVIEINSDFRQSSSEEAVSIDEAIAWAKQGYNTKKSDLGEHAKDQTNAYESIHRTMDGTGPMLSPPEEKQKKSKTEGKERSEDEDVKHWSSGNENNIRMLLSTLHNILWPNSGWCMIDLTSLTESSQVKKAYQKARLCLHPDKLQQRGATLSQKYVAEKAFAILQDAFVSRDVFYNQSTMQGVSESFWEAWNKQGVHGLEGLRTVLKA